MVLKCWLGLSHGMEWQPHIASVPTDRLWMLSQHWINLPGAGSSRLTGCLQQMVNVLLLPDKDEYNSRLSFEARAPANICNKASTPQQQCSSPSLRFSYLCSPLRSGVTLSQRAQLPSWYRNTGFAHCEESIYSSFGWLRGHLLCPESQFRLPAGTWRRSKTWTDAALYSFISSPLL